MERTLLLSARVEHVIVNAECPSDDRTGALAATNNVHVYMYRKSNSVLPLPCHLFETAEFLILLANVNSRLRSLFAVARPSVVCRPVCRLFVVCNVRAPYPGDCNFRQYFCGIRYLGHPLTFTENFTDIVPGEPLRRGS